MKVIGIGDSHVCPDPSFVFEAAKLLGASFIDCGVPGHRVADVLARIESVAEADADVAVLVVGTNDIPGSFWDGVGEFRCSYPRLLDVLTSRYGRTIACTIPPRPNDETATRLAQVANIEIGRAASERGVEIFDLFSLLCEAPAHLARALDFADTVHLSAIGAARAGVALATQIATYDQPAPQPRADCAEGEELALKNKILLLEKHCLALQRETAAMKIERDRLEAQVGGLRKFVLDKKLPLLAGLARRAEIARLEKLGFDGAYYLSKNVDVALAQADPLLHFVVQGRRENRAFRFKGGAESIE